MNTISLPPYPYQKELCYLDHVDKEIAIEQHSQNGLDSAIMHHYNPASVRPRKTNGELEAHVIQLACGEAPEGYTRWTLELLTEEVNKKGVAEPVSKETVRVMLKKMNLSLT